MSWFKNTVAIAPLTCPSCGGTLACLYTSADCTTQSRLWECRDCSYPDSRWVLLIGGPRRLSDQPDLFRGMIDL